MLTTAAHNERHSAAALVLCVACKLREKPGTLASLWAMVRTQANTRL
jgi:hypothetical protein